MICFAFLLKLFLSIMARFTQSPNKGSLQTCEQNRRATFILQNFLFSRKTTLSCHCMTTSPEAKPIRKKPQQNKNRTATKNFSEVPWPQIVYRLSISTPTVSTEDLLPKYLLDLSPLFANRQKERSKGGSSHSAQCQGCTKQLQRSIDGM